MKKEPTPDIAIDAPRASGLATIRGRTDAGQGWIAEHVVFSQWQVLDDGGIALEPRYLPEITRGAESAGLVVEGSR